MPILALICLVICLAVQDMSRTGGLPKQRMNNATPTCLSSATALTRGIPSSSHGELPINTRVFPSGQIATNISNAEETQCSQTFLPCEEKATEDVQERRRKSKRIINRKKVNADAVHLAAEGAALAAVMAELHDRDNHNGLPSLTYRAHTPLFIYISSL